MQINAMPNVWFDGSWEFLRSMCEKALIMAAGIEGRTGSLGTRQSPPQKGRSFTGLGEHQPSVVVIISMAEVSYIP